MLHATQETDMPLPFLSKPPVSVATSQKSPWPRLFGFAAVLLLSAACVLMTGYFARAWAEPSADASTIPIKNGASAYVEGGPYTDYQQIFAGTVRGLAKLGLIENGDVPVPENSESTREMWAWLCANAGGGRMEFLPDGYYSANWDEKLRVSNKADIMRRIHERGDVDIILAFGTWAGQDMATDEHSVPTFSMSVTDAVDAGIVASAEDSGLDHVHAQVEPGRYERQVAIFPRRVQVPAHGRGLRGYPRRPQLQRHSRRGEGRAGTGHRTCALHHRAEPPGSGPVL